VERRLSSERQHTLYEGYAFSQPCKWHTVTGRQSYSAGTKKRGRESLLGRIVCARVTAFIEARINRNWLEGPGLS
jgi:hypothetical protein